MERLVYLLVLGLEFRASHFLGRHYHLRFSTRPLFVLVIFEIVLQTICLGWLPTMILQDYKHSYQGLAWKDLLQELAYVFLETMKF
jgi:hypothetical protein